MVLDFKSFIGDIMRIKIANIGMIEKADIILDGLTVITGENNTGKSTIGKLLYSVIKVINNYRAAFQSYVMDYLRTIIYSIITKYNNDLRSDLQIDYDEVWFTIYDEILDKVTI